MRTPSTRTATEKHRITSMSERQMQLEREQVFPCDECEAPAGEPCVNRYGDPLNYLTHLSRQKAEQQAREEASR